MDTLSSEANEVVFATSEKTDGNMSLRRGEKTEVVQNRKKFLKKSGVALEDCVVLHTPHEDRIEIVDKSYKGRGAFNFDDAVVAEALITKEKGVVLCLLIADCFPVTYYDTKKKIVALAHLGWKPTGKKLAAKVVSAMKNSFDSNPADIIIAVGPGIHKESYVIADPIQKTLPEWQSFLEKLPSGETSIDLVSYIQSQLQEAGVLKENINISPHNTATSEHYYSHYRSERTDEPEGRFMTMISIKN